MRRMGVGAVVALLVVLGACSGGGGDSATEAELAGQGSSDAEESGADFAQEEQGDADGDLAATADGVGDEAAGAGAAPAPAAPAPDQETGGQAPLPQVSRGPERIIKEGTVRLEVADGEFDAAYAGVVALAPRYGGDVLASATSTEQGRDGDGDGPSSGSVTLRVPVEEYESLLAGVQDLGTVRSRDVRSEDVSVEFVDLESRQRNLEAQERFYLELLGRAEAVPDAIAVQQQLNGVTEQLEQIKGRLQFLEARTSFSTLTVELFEPAAAPLVVEPEPDDGRPSLARFWRTAQDAFLNVVGGTLVVVSFLAPLVLPLGAIALLVRALRRRPTQPAPSRPTAAPGRTDDDDREPERV